MSIVEGRPRLARFLADRVPLLALISGLTAWLWPIGLGGKMPVGGDVTGFSIGLMAVLKRAIGEGRLPLWNDLWGYGFPGLAESQMGVYYPPHWILYGLLPVEWAYTASLVLHTYLTGLGGYWAGRRFGASAPGAALGAWAFAAGGMFVVHLPHQWAYTVGCWMPWAWGLAWTIARGEGRPRTALMLSAVQAIQVLPGHFQLAFETQVGVLGFAIIALFSKPRGSIRAALSILLSLLAAVPLAAMQLLPTARLAALASARRGPDYLSGFAATPIHLVSYVAPGLFHRSPLWRPIAWDPFHTSPEEHLAYVGLVALFLATSAVFRGWKRVPAVPALTAIVLGSLWFGLGPYVPGFNLLATLPGFSFFRAPARWGLATSLGIGLLAALGFDRLREVPRIGRSLVRFTVAAALFPALIILGFEAALFATDGEGVSAIATAFERASALSPWKDDPSFASVMATVRRPQNDLRVRIGLAREGFRNVPRSGLSLDRERGSIYAREMAATGVTLLTLLALAALAGRRRAFSAALVVLSGLELLYWNRLRPIELGPIRPLEAQSPVLAALRSAPRGTRSADNLSNLAKIAGSAPIGAYRTLDLPVVPSLTALARAPLSESAAARAVSEALRATGSSVRILGAGDLGAFAGTVPPIRDEALASWLFGADWVAGEGANAARFGLWRREAGDRAWFVPAEAAARALETLDPSREEASLVLGVLARAKPADSRRSEGPEGVEFRSKTDRPGWLIVSMLHDPEWAASVSEGPEVRDATIRRAFGSSGAGAWMGIELPRVGDWTIRLRYRGEAARLGLGVSGVAWIAWVLAYWKAGRNRHDPSGGRRGVGVRGPGAVPDPPAPPGREGRHGDLPAG